LTQKPTYFPGLDALRFYAALSVMVGHIGTNFAELRTMSANYPVTEWLSIDAQSAVSLFFVLSGFLITYLLLKEHQSTQNIDVKRFYMRRILRIWPVYYLVVIVGFALFPLLLGTDYALYSSSFNQIVLVMFLLANFTQGLGPLGHLWTIAMEEQFYLIWPWIMKSRSRLIKIAFGIIFVKLAVIFAALILQNDSLMLRARGFRFECMAYGALAAYLYFYDHPLLQMIYSHIGRLLSVIGMLYMIVWDVPYTAINNHLVSVISALFILNLATNANFGIKLNFPILNYLGQISYGIYMYHFPLLYLVLFLARKLEIPETHLYNAGLYVVTIGMTLLIATVSYRWYETPFLLLKKRFNTPQSEFHAQQMISR
jgi:peptidoglycan/LPS O-acetylase OafA/YrhL